MLNILLTKYNIQLLKEVYGANDLLYTPRFLYLLILNLSIKKSIHIL